MSRSAKKEDQKPAKGWIVIDLINFAKPLRLYHNDGDKPVAEGGILFLTPSDQEPTTFEEHDEAVEAVRRTVAHGEAHGYNAINATWTDEAMRVIPAGQYEEAVKMLREDEREKRKAKLADKIEEQAEL